MSSSSSTASSSGGGGNANANGLGGGASGGTGGGSGYSMIQLRSGSRPEYSPIGGSREREGRDDQRRERDLRDGDVRGGAGGKKNPLSIGSIISDDAR